MCPSTAVPDADVLVVGFGAAGAAAALTASNLGHSALIVEKQPQTAHTPNTRMSGGLIMGVGEAVIATDYLDHCAGGMIPRAISATWAERARDLPAWLDAQGTNLRLGRVGGGEHPQFRGADAIDVLQIGVGDEDRHDRAGVGLLAAGARLGNASPGAETTGLALFAALEAAVASRPTVRVRWDSPAVRLTRDDDGVVTGVAVRHGDGVTELSSRYGVILTCGGYEYDAEMKLNYLKAAPIYFYGNPGNTGDGVRMAQAVGADLWHMNQMIGRAIGHFERPDGPELNVPIFIGPPGYVITDKHGQRYANEYPQARMDHVFYYEMLAFDWEARDYGRIPSYWFFDERRRSAGPLVSTSSGAVGVGFYDWSPDNRKEIDNGWISTGSSIAEAAEAAGVLDPLAAQRSVERFNEGCREGGDALGRPGSTLIPLDSPPYYCVPLYPGGSNTCGGPRRDEWARVLDTAGKPIPGLFAAGELGEAVGLLYPAHGANLSEAMCFGQIAVETALSVPG